MTLSAQLRYDRIQGLVGDRQRRFGALVYEAGPPGRFAVHFDRVLVDERLDRQDRWYVFDGVWLVERHEDQKLFMKRQVAPPGGDGADPLALGEGPIPIPITSKKDRVLKRFDVEVVAPTESDPVDTVHLRLAPKAGVGVDFESVDLWYGRQTLLPVRVRTVDDSENESVIDVSDAEVNGPVNRALLDTSEPRDPGWRVEVTPWERDRAEVSEGSGG